MTLRARLIVAAAVCLLVVVASFFGIAQRQQQVLFDQLDAQLTLAANRVTTLATADRPEVAVTTDRSGEFYIGLVANGALTTSIGPASTPDLAPDIDDIRTSPRGVPVTVATSDDGVAMRVIMQDLDAGTIVIGHSTERIDDSIRSLRVSGLVAVGAVGAVAFLVGWWVNRLSSQPIRTATEVASAITAGRHGERLPASSKNTEAATLGTAMNLMLDATAETEARLRSFVADASHELRTPLTTLMGYADMHRQGLLTSDEAIDDAMRRIRGEAKRMSTIVEHLFLQSNLDEGTTPIEKAVVDVDQLLGDVAADARVVQPDRTITVAASSGVAVSADPDRLVQLVSILVSNALTHTPASASVALAAEHEPGAVVIRVTDAGPGIAPEHLSRVFDRFYRVHEGRDRLHGGSGLGLAIARSIAEAHGGTLDVESQVGQGSTFVLRLPDTEDGGGQSED